MHVVDELANEFGKLVIGCVSQWVRDERFLQRRQERPVVFPFASQPVNVAIPGLGVERSGQCTVQFAKSWVRRVAFQCHYLSHAAELAGSLRRSRLKFWMAR